MRYKRITKQNRKIKKCTFMQKSMECAYRKYEKVNSLYTQKINRVTEY